jgi:PhnB protein
MSAIATTSTKATAKTTPAPSSADRTLQVQPYLMFDGRCDEALEFYRRALGAEVTMCMRFKDAPPQPEGGMCTPPPDIENKVMHASFRIGGSEILASDGDCQGRTAFQGFSLSLTAPTEAGAKRMFAALSEGGAVQMPLGKTFFSAAFGMVADRFGVSWMVYVKPAM